VARALRDTLRAQAQASREAADLRAFIAAAERTPPGALDLKSWA
jgi:hypothetical protein